MMTLLYAINKALLSTQTGFVYVRYLRLTNFCLVFDLFGLELTILKCVWELSQKGSLQGTQGRRNIVESFLIRRKQNGDLNVWNFRHFLFDMSPNVLTVKVRVLTSDFNFWNGVNGYM